MPDKMGEMKPKAAKPALKAAAAPPAKAAGKPAPRAAQSGPGGKR